MLNIIVDFLFSDDDSERQSIFSLVIRKLGRREDDDATLCIWFDFDVMSLANNAH